MRKILNVSIASTTTRRVINAVVKHISKQTQCLIFTPNPEIVFEAQHDLELMTALERGTINIPDGIGIAAANSFLSLPIENGPFRWFKYVYQGIVVGLSLLTKKELVSDSLSIIKGRELFVSLVELANKKKWKVYLLGGRYGEAKRAMQVLSKEYPSVRFETNHGPRVSIDARPVAQRDSTLQSDVISEINSFKPHLLFVAFGHPKQEKWIVNNHKSLKAIIIMGVGGSFRYVAGSSKAPPEFMSKSGFEWLWRLITEPKRIARIFRATILFPWSVFQYKLSMSGA